MSIDGVEGQPMHDGAESLPAQLWTGNTASGAVELRVEGEWLLTRREGLVLRREGGDEVAVGRSAVELLEQFMRRNRGQVLTIVHDQGTVSGSIEFHTPGNWPVIGVMLTPPYGPTLWDYRAGNVTDDD